VTFNSRQSPIANRQSSIAKIGNRQSPKSAISNQQSAI